MPTILCDYLVMTVDGIGSCDTEIQLWIFTRYQILTEPTHFLKDLSLEHDHVRWADEIAAEQGGIMVRGRSAIMYVPISFRPKPSIIPADKPGIRVFLKGF
jgi:hypothetical protein